MLAEARELMWRRRRSKLGWRERRKLELLVLGAIYAFPDSTREQLAGLVERSMDELLEPLWALISKGYITRRTDPTVLAGRYNPVEVSRETES